MDCYKLAKQLVENDKMISAPKFLHPLERTCKYKLDDLRKFYMVSKLEEKHEKHKMIKSENTKQVELFFQHMSYDMLANEWIRRFTNPQLRLYVVEKVLPVLVMGLAEVCKEADKLGLVDGDVIEIDYNFNPINLLASFLMRNNPLYSTGVIEQNEYVRMLRQAVKKLKYELAINDTQEAEIRLDAKYKRLKRLAENRQMEELHESRRIIFEEQILDWIPFPDSVQSLNQISIDKSLLISALKEDENWDELSAKLPIFIEDPLCATAYSKLLRELTDEYNKLEFGNFLRHLKSCAETYKNGLESDFRIKAWKKTFTACDKEKIKLLNRNIIVSILQEFWNNAIPCVREQLRDPFTYPILNLEDYLINENNIYHTSGEVLVLIGRNKRNTVVKNDESNFTGIMVNQGSEHIRGSDTSSTVSDTLLMMTKKWAEAGRKRSSQNENIILDPNILEENEQEEIDNIIVPRIVQENSNVDNAISESTMGIKNPYEPSYQDDLDNMDTNTKLETADDEEDDDDINNNNNKYENDNFNINNKISKSPRNKTSAKTSGLGGGGGANVKNRRISINSKVTESTSLPAINILPIKSWVEKTLHKLSFKDAIDCPRFINLLENFMRPSTSKDTINRLSAFLRVTYPQYGDENIKNAMELRRMAVEEERKLICEQIFNLWPNSISSYINLADVLVRLKAYKKGSESDRINDFVKRFTIRNKIFENQLTLDHFTNLVFGLCKVFGIGHLELESQAFIELTTILFSQLKDELVERDRMEDRRSWLTTLRVLAVSGIGDLEEFFDKLYRIIDIDNKAHGRKGRKLSSYVALLENIEDLDESGIKNRYTTNIYSQRLTNISASIDQTDIIGKYVDNSLPSISFKAMSLKRIIYIKNVSDHTDIHFWNKKSTEDLKGSLICIPLMDKCHHSFGVFTIDSIRSDENYSFVDREIEFYIGVSHIISTAYQYSYSRHRMIKAFETFISYLGTGQEKIKRIDLYLPKINDKSLLHVLKWNRNMKEGSVQSLQPPVSFTENNATFKRHLFRSIYTCDSVVEQVGDEYRMCFPFKFDGSVAFLMEMNFGQNKYIQLHENVNLISSLSRLVKALVELSSMFHVSPNRRSRTVFLQVEKFLRLNDQRLVPILIYRYHLVDLRVKLYGLSDDIFVKLKESSNSSVCKLIETVTNLVDKAGKCDNIRHLLQTVIDYDPTSPENIRKCKVVHSNDNDSDYNGDDNSFTIPNVKFSDIEFDMICSSAIINFKEWLTVVRFLMNESRKIWPKEDLISSEKSNRSLETIKEEFDLPEDPSKDENMEQEENFEPGDL